MLAGLITYIPIDRRYTLALTEDEQLPTHSIGAALFADIYGFTGVADALAKELGFAQAVEILTQSLNQLYNALIVEVHHYRGSVIGFVGDAITCWFDRDDGLQATACGLALQEAVKTFAQLPILKDKGIDLSIKVGIATGPVRRFQVGNPNIQYLDTLAGLTVHHMSLAEKVAQRDEVVLAPHTCHQLKDNVEIHAYRKHPLLPDPFGIVNRLLQPVQANPWPPFNLENINIEQIRPWLLPPIYERLKAGQSHFLAELRPASSLFLRFTGLDYDRDEAAGEKLNKYVCWVQQVVQQYEGSVIQLTIGDKGSFFYIAFGAPIAHNNDPERAIRAALALLHPVDDMRFIETVQIGLARGKMRTGAYGSTTRRSYGVISDQTIIAARLMMLAKPETIYCDYSMYHLVHNQFNFKTLPNMKIKGKKTPITIYQLLDQQTDGPFNLSSQPTPTTQNLLSDTPERPFVGRARELARLKTYLDKVEARESKIVIIEGEPGIGKSRFVDVLAKEFKARNLTYFIGSGRSMEQQTPYRAWRDILAIYFELHSAMTLAEREEQVRQAIQRLTPRLSDRIPLFNDILNLDIPESTLTASLNPSLRHSSLVSLLISLFKLWVADKPLILVLEDTHWLDDLSWELTLAIARSLTYSTKHFLLILVTRPLHEHSITAQYITRVKRLPGTCFVSLKTLSVEENVLVAAGCLGVAVDQLPLPIIELIKARSGGNPFFAEELVLTLKDQNLIKIITLTDGQTKRCLLTPNFDEAIQTLPDTIQGLILDRVDRLIPEQQLTLKIASVIGRIFSFETLRDTLGQYITVSEELLSDYLSKLVTFDLTPMETPHPNLQYRFKHMITQEVVYRTLLFEQRRQLHRTVARWYETTFGQNGTSTKSNGGGHHFDILKPPPATLLPYISILFHHYHEAEDVDHECYYATLAGEQAANRFANTEAINYLNRALELIPDTNYATRYTLLLKRQRIYYLIGDYQQQGDDLILLEDLIEHLSDEQQIQLSLEKAQHAYGISNHETAIKTAKKAIKLARRRGDTAQEAAGNMRWGHSLWILGDYLAAEKRLKRALELNPPQKIKADIFRTLGNVLEMQDQYDEGLVYKRNALQVYREIGDKVGEGATLNNFGVSGARQGDYADSKFYFELALQCGQEIGYRKLEAQALHNLGVILSHLGSYTESKTRLENALAVCYQIGDQHTFAEILETLSFLFHRLEDDQKAKELAEQALDIGKMLGYPTLQGLALQSLGQALLGLGHLEEAITAFNDATIIRRELGELNASMEPQAGLARVAMAQQNLPLALEYVENILKHLTTNTLDGTNNPFRVYLTCYQVLAARQDERAIDVLENTHRLLQVRAARITDETLRHTYLNNVNSHQQIIIAWQIYQKNRI